MAQTERMSSAVGAAREAACREGQWEAQVQGEVGRACRTLPSASSGALDAAELPYLFRKLGFQDRDHDNFYKYIHNRSLPPLLSFPVSCGPRCQNTPHTLPPPLASAHCVPLLR